ncbi:MAG: putative recombination protein RmuC [Phycisphaerales bacterium]|nr:putative recombination protein RmuC [Phycisphaerales bacterium]
MEVVWILIGLVLGGGVAAVVTFLVVDRRSRQALVTAQTDRTIATERAVDAQRNLAAITQTAEAAKAQLATEQQERATLAAKLSAERDSVQRQTEALSAAVAAVETLRNDNATMQQDRAALIAKLDAERQALQQMREQMDQSNARLKESFAEASKDALKASTESFLTLAEQRFKTLQTEAAGTLEQKRVEMGQLLQPMQHTLAEYRTKLTEIEQSRSAAYVDIKENLAAVAAVQLNLSIETKQLVTALRKPQGRGRWGELTLRRLFELAGMADRVTFSEQVSTDDGRLRPDCIVQLPEDRQVIVDSKCVLDAFLDASACTDDILRVAHIARHSQQVRSRVSELASKAYWESFGRATDYVVLFLPGEAFLYAAVENDPTLIEDALNQRVIVASPTTLLGLLRVIEHGWRHKAIEENAEEIRKLGTRLYERIQKVAGDLQKLGTQLGRTTQQYNEAIRSLESRVLPSARDMAKLGVSGKAEAIPVMEEIVEAPQALRADRWKELAAPTLVPADIATDVE